MNLCERNPYMRAIFLGAAIFCVFALSAAAQSAREPLATKLPPDAIVYVEWRGMDSVRAAEKTNHVLQLLQDPDLARSGHRWRSISRSMKRGMVNRLPRSVCLRSYRSWTTRRYSG